MKTNTNLLISAVFLLAAANCFGQPSISIQPADQTVNQSFNATFRAVASGTPPLTYQWFFGSNAIAGAITNVLIVTNAQLRSSMLRGWASRSSIVFPRSSRPSHAMTAAWLTSPPTLASHARQSRGSKVPEALAGGDSSFLRGHPSRARVTTPPSERLDVLVVGPGRPASPWLPSSKRPVPTFASSTASSTASTSRAPWPSNRAPWSSCAGLA